MGSDDEPHQETADEQPLSSSNLERPRRSVLRGIGAGVGTLAIGLPSTTGNVLAASATDTGQSSEQPKDRPDLQVVNNRKTEATPTIEITDGVRTVAKQDLQMASALSQTVSKVDITERGVYTIKLKIDGKTVDTGHAEATETGFPSYLSVVADIRDSGSYVAISEV